MKCGGASYHEVVRLHRLPTEKSNCACAERYPCKPFELSQHCILACSLLPEQYRTP